uniref:Uncharacterized protein n=1 Tax=Aegilops tauschii TaxID=37682 RepID=M8CSA6_AEGTA
MKGSSMEVPACLDGKEDLAVSGTMPVRPGSGRRNKKESSSKARKVVMAEASITSNHLPEKRYSNKGSSMDKEPVIMPAARLDGKVGTCGDLSCTDRKHPVLGEARPLDSDSEDEDDDFFKELNYRMADFQQYIWKEIKEKGYVEVADNYEEQAADIRLEGYKRAYRTVFGTDPPPELPKDA